MTSIERRTRPLAAAALVALASLAAACGGDDGTGPRAPLLTRADVAGQYELVALSFDPQGTLPQKDLLARLDSVNVPQLVVSSAKDSLQLVFRDPNGGLFITEPGSYRLGDTGITVTFKSSTEPAKLLLPRTFTLGYSEEEADLAFAGTIQADTARLFELVPEFSGEPVTNPLPGSLQVVFHRANP